jgi:hypothetical protein
MVALCCLKNQELQILNVDSDVGSKVPIKNYLFIINILYMMYGRETGIRTLGTFAGTTDFESVPFDHSGTSPRLAVG